MNPITLKFKNYCNYKDLDLSFDNNGVMPIVGNNGNGKSTIFSGISLALYGKVLKEGIEIPVKELITDDGSKEMQIKLQFSHNGNIYRIERAYKISVSKADVETCNQVKCEFYQMFGDTEIPLSAKSKDTTDKKIITILGKDCDNFCNSAFFPQGEESRLAKLKPSQFIEEISKLKNITIWEELRERCKKELDSVLSVLEGVNSYIEECKIEISHKEEIQEQIKELNKKIIEKRELIQEIETSLESISDQKSKLNTSINNINKLEKDILEINGEISELKNDIEFSKNKINELNSTISNGEFIRKQNEIYKDLCIKKETFDKSLSERNNIMNKISSIEKEVQIAENKVRQDFNELLSKKNSNLSIVQNYNSLNSRYDYCVKFMQSLDIIQQQYDSLGLINQQNIIDITKLNSRNEQLSFMINEETQKVHKIIGTCTCSECERPVDPNSLEQIKNYKAAKIDSYKVEGRNNLEKINQLTALVENNKVIILNLKQQLSQKEACSREVGQLQNQLHNIDTASKEIEHIEPRLLELQNIINNGKYSDKSDLLNSLNNNLKNNLYNSEEHNIINSKYLELQGINIQAHKLNEAELEFPNLKKRHEDFINRLFNKESKLKDLLLETQKFKKNDILESLKSIVEKEYNYKKELIGYKTGFDSFMKEFGGKQTILESILNKEVKIEEKIKEVADTKRRQYLLERSMEMYSKQGIPTLIIENMLPDIEKEANSLLQSMNAERSICFERPKRADGTYMDKIVIMVRDRRGKKRSFNTFSGAECFQISFALRVAICGSEEVMFIDEGFGKLDNNNIKSIIQTLGALKSKFSKIILITHVEKLIEMFNNKLIVDLDVRGYSTAKWIKG
jgi:exonuclease SbcC